MEKPIWGITTAGSHHMDHMGVDPGGGSTAQIVVTWTNIRQSKDQYGGHGDPSTIRHSSHEAVQNNEFSTLEHESGGEGAHWGPEHGL